MIARGGASWQIVLADLALILFLVTLSGLAGASADQSGAVGSEPEPPAQQFSASQALYRSVAGGQSLSEWLEVQQADPRATLTIFASFAPDDFDQAWKTARAYADTGQGEGYSVRIVISEGIETDIHASLGYDAPQSKSARSR